MAESLEERKKPPPETAEGRDIQPGRTGHRGNKLKDTEQLGGPLLPYRIS